MWVWVSIPNQPKLKPIPPNHPPPQSPTPTPPYITYTGDGASLTTFFRKAKKREPTLLVVKAMTGEVFGGFASKSWIDKGEVGR